MKLCDALASALRDWDVGQVFGVSGANIEHLHDSIYRLGGERLRAVLAKSEVGAAFMADAKARVHGTLGVCCATSGGGMMNLAVGIAESHADGVPVLAIVGQVPRALEGKGGFQDSSGVGRTLDAHGLFRAIAKHVVRLDDAQRFWSQLREAAHAALSDHPGPAVLLVPRDAFELEVGDPPPDWPTRLSALRERVSAPDLSPVLAALRAAKRPVLVCGAGVARAGASIELALWARTLRLPVVTTMADPAAFPHEEPLFLGVVGAAGHPSAHTYLAHDADLILAVGCSLSAMVRAPFAQAFERARVLAIDLDVDAIRRAVPSAEVFCADALLAASALTSLWRADPFVVPPVEDYVHTRYAPCKLDAARPSDCAPLGASDVLSELEPFLPRRGYLLFDAGNCAATAIHQLSFPAQLRSTIALGMGGMGYAIAGGVGTQLGAAAGERTLVLCGDGAFLMLGLEVHTAVELGLAILFVVFNDGKHGMCVTRQRLMFGGRLTATEYRPLDAAAAARSLGSSDSLWAARVASRAELNAALRDYERVSDRPGVLDVVLSCEEMPPFAPFLSSDAATLEVQRPPLSTQRRPAA
jgi:acetolactate synthase-1/2/3 large subunit